MARRLLQFLIPQKTFGDIPEDKPLDVAYGPQLRTLTRALQTDYPKRDVVVAFHSNKDTEKPRVNEEGSETEEHVTRLRSRIAEAKAPALGVAAPRVVLSNGGCWVGAAQVVCAP